MKPKGLKGLIRAFYLVLLSFEGLKGPYAPTSSQNQRKTAKTNQNTNLLMAVISGLMPNKKTPTSLPVWGKGGWWPRSCFKHSKQNKFACRGGVEGQTLTPRRLKHM